MTAARPGGPVPEAGRLYARWSLGLPPPTMPSRPLTADRAAEVKLHTRLDVAAIQNLVLGH